MVKEFKCELCGGEVEVAERHFMTIFDRKGGECLKCGARYEYECVETIALIKNGKGTIDGKKEETS